MTTTSPASIRRSRTASKQAVSESNTRAGPRWWRRSWPASFTIEPSGARLPRRIAWPPVALIGVSIGWTTCWPGRLDDVRGDLRDRPPVDRRLVAVEEVALEQLAHDERDAARVVHVRGRVPAAGPHVGDQRRAVGDRGEVVERQRDAELARRSPAGGARRSCCRRSRRPTRWRSRAALRVTMSDGRMSWRTRVITSSPARRAASSLAGSSAGMPLRPAGRQAEELEHRGHRVGRELAAARAGARAGAVLDLVQLLEA